MIQASLDPSGAGARISLAGYLSREQFTAYRAILAECGARFLAAERCNLLPLAQLPALASSLKGCGLVLSLDRELAAGIKAEAEEARAALSIGDERLAEAEARLAGTGLSLFRYQKTGIRWLAGRKNALLADDMGLGKTVQLLLALPPGAAALAVVPAAVAVNWAAEAKRWRPDLACYRVKSGASWRWPNAGELVVSTYGLLPTEALPAPAGCFLLADEAHLLKGSRTARAKAWRALLQNVTEGRGSVWLATGTPLLNRPLELWNVLKAAALTEEAFGSYPRFCALFSGSKGRFGMEWGSEVSPEAPLALQKVCLHRRKADVLADLPPKRRTEVRINGIPAETVRLCDEALAALSAKGINLAELGPKDDLSGLISGPVFQLMSRARAQLASAKLPAALELVESYEEAGEPLVVASAHLEPLKAIGSRPGWGLIIGETSPDERGRIAAEFQAGKLRGIALSFAAGGVGITLTRASNMLLVDLPWTPALVQQAEDRCHRIGQKASLLVTRLVVDHPLDARVVELLTLKQELIEAAIGASAVQEDHLPTSDSRLLSASASLLEAAEAPAPKPAAQSPVALFTPAPEVVSRFRPAASPLEAWAQSTLLTVAGMDQDRAAQRNGVGFSKMDNDFGHSLASALAQYGRLSEKQWASAIRLAQRYKKQAAEEPPQACVS